MLSLCVSLLVCAVTVAASPGVAWSDAAVPPGYVRVAHVHAVPPPLLYAIACAESRRRLPDGTVRPWPWTLNVAGRGQFYASRRAAHQALIKALRAGTNVDIGLAQINWRWHHALLGNPWQALDPYLNLHAAGHLLRAHYQRVGDWWLAVGQYHAPAPAAMARRAHYREQVGTCLRPG